MLEQNYPNPFNPITLITYEVPKVENVTIRVYDCLGRQVSVLINNEMKSPGIHKISFNATNLPSGVYFCRMEAGNFTNTKKLILLK
jgi:hypothetical protein